MADELRERLDYIVPAHVEVQSGADTNTPSALFVDADYDLGDGTCGLHASAKNANEPAIVYVRSDALMAAERRADALAAENKRLWAVIREALGNVQAYLAEFDTTHSAQVNIAQVPREPTQAMTQEAMERIGIDPAAARVVYKTMIAAADRNTPTTTDAETSEHE